MAIGALLYPERPERPTFRKDCEQVARPCPYVGCRHNLLVNVNPNTGSIKITWPEKEVWEVDTPSCALDVATHGGATLEEIGEVLGCTRERVRQIEAEALAKLRDGGAEELAKILEDVKAGRSLDERPIDGVRLRVVG